MSSLHLCDPKTQVTSEQREMIIDTLRALLNSPTFCKSKRYPAFLEFVVQAGLNEDSDAVKERSVGAAIFDRPINYDTGGDSVVRVTAGEVRRRMAAYFSEHPDAPVRIELPLGCYRAEFHFRPVAFTDTPSRPAEPQAAVVAVAEDTLLEPANLIHEQLLPTAKLQASVRQPWRKSLGIGAAAMLLASVTGAGLWHHFHESALRKFWQPMVRDNEATLVLLGKTNGPETIPLSNGQPITEPPKGNGQRSLVLDDAIAAAEICTVVREYGGGCKMAPADRVRADDIRGKSIIILGGLNGPLTQRFLTTLPYQPRFDPVSQPQSAQRMSIFEHKPTGDVLLWSLGHDEPAAEFGTDYAIVARFHSNITDALVEVVAGLGPPGTNSAGEYVSTPQKVEDLLSRAPRGWQGINFEAILKVDVVEGSPGHVEVIASRFW